MDSPCKVMKIRLIDGCYWGEKETRRDKSVYLHSAKQANP